MERKGLKWIALGCLMALLFIMGGLLYKVQQDQQNNIVITPVTPTTSMLWTPTPDTATPAAVIPTEAQSASVNNISYLYMYVLRYNGQGKGQTPTFEASHTWVLHWQCYPGSRPLSFPIAVFRGDGQAQAMANIWTCKQGHSSGDSPVYSPGKYFVTVTPEVASAHYDLFVEVYQ